VRIFAAFKAHPVTHVVRFLVADSSGNSDGPPFWGAGALLRRQKILRARDSAGRGHQIYSAEKAELWGSFLSIATARTSSH